MKPLVLNDEIGIRYKKLIMRVKHIDLFSWYGITPTKAEQTVYWFMYGKRWKPLVPEHFNCRCIMLNSKFGAYPK